MKELPPEAAALLQRARVAHEPSAEELARSLSMLHASLAFAPEVTSSPMRAPEVDEALVARGGLLAARAAKGALLTLVLGAAVGVGWLWFRSPPDTATSLPSVAPAAPPAPRPPAAIPEAPHTSPDGREPVDASKVVGALEPSVVIEPPAARTAVVTRADLSADERAPASRSVPDRARAGRERARRPSVFAAPAASVPGAPSPPAENRDAATSSSDSAARTRVPPLPSELELIDGALRSLRDHDPKRSLALLAQHAALYPHGKLATERRGLHVLALCAAGERVRAAHERAAYLAEDPNTLMAERVRRTCRPEGEP